MEIQLVNNENNIFRFLKDDFNYIDFCPKRGGLVTDWTLYGKKIFIIASYPRSIILFRIFR